jgi:hypothetical protein
MKMKVKLANGSNYLGDSGYSKEEQFKIYNEQLDEIIKNPRWYLDNLEYMVEYRVSVKREIKRKKETFINENTPNKEVGAQ